MAGRGSLGLGSVLNRLLIVGLVCLCGYLYWQVVTLQKEVAHTARGFSSSQGANSPWDSYKLTLPSNIDSFGQHNINLLNDAKNHMAKAQAAAASGNFGEAAQESAKADDELKQVEAGASSQTRAAISVLRSTVSDLQRRVHASEQAFGA